MSYKDEETTTATSSPSNEITELRNQLAAAQKEAAIGQFLARAAQEFPTLSVTDIKALTANHLSFRDGILAGEDVALQYLGSRSFLAPTPQSTGNFGNQSAADSQAHVRHHQREARKLYVGQFFGPGSSSKMAADLSKADLEAYRKLRLEAKKLGLIG